MKPTTTMSRTINQLERIYNVLNTDCWAGELPVPVITVQTVRCSNSSPTGVWQRKEDSAYELVIPADTLNCELEEIVAMIQHEMVHIYCHLHNLHDTSRGGTYHNATFKKVAEEHGLICLPDDKYKWVTRASDDLTAYVMEKGWNELQIGRNELPIGKRSLEELDAYRQANKPCPRPSSTRKLVCPICGQSVRTTHRDANIKCGICDVRMVEDSFVHKDKAPDGSPEVNVSDRYSA